MKSKTTLQVDLSTLARLKTFKKFQRQSYNELLNSLLNEVEEEELTSKDITEIQEALEEVKMGKVESIESVAKEFGIKL